MKNNIKEMIINRTQKNKLFGSSINASSNINGFGGGPILEGKYSVYRQSPYYITFPI